MDVWLSICLQGKLSAIFEKWNAWYAKEVDGLLACVLLYLFPQPSEHMHKHRVTDFILNCPCSQVWLFCYRFYNTVHAWRFICSTHLANNISPEWNALVRTSTKAAEFVQDKLAWVFFCGAQAHTLIDYSVYKYHGIGHLLYLNVCTLPWAV